VISHPKPPETASLPHDERMRLFIGGLDAKGRALPMTVEALQSATTDWRLGAAVPAEIAGLLQTARDLFVHAWFHYEFLVVAGAWSLLAVEATMRRAYPTRGTEGLKKVLGRALADGLVTDEEHDRLRAAADLRNRLLHAERQSVWTFGMAAGVIAASHAVVAGVFDRTAEGGGSTCSEASPL
jgi:hypothetical protein